MEIFRDNTGKIYDWVVGSLDNGEHYPNDLTLGVFNDNILIAGIIYSVVDEDVFLSIYSTSPRWCSKKTLSLLFYIPFDMFSAKKVKCAVSNKNVRINKLLNGLGFIKDDGRAKRVDGSHLVIYSIDNKMLKNKEWFKDEWSSR